LEKIIYIGGCLTLSLEAMFTFYYTTIIATVAIYEKVKNDVNIRDTLRGSWEELNTEIYIKNPFKINQRTSNLDNTNFSNEY